MAGYIGSKASVTQVDGYNTTEADAEFLNQTEGDARYVELAGDTLTGALTGTDLTLSGGVYLGGTGSANKLDDYEEGYHDAIVYIDDVAFSGTYYSHRLRYVKIGSAVTVVGRLYFATGIPTGGTNYFSFSLPFAPPSNTQYETSFEIQNIRFNDSFTFRINSEARARLQNDGSNTAMDVSNPHINVNVTYIAAS